MPLSPHPGLLDLLNPISRIELIDQYTELADKWVASGLLQHTALVRAEDRELIETLSDLGFGRQQSYATRKTAHITHASPSGYAIRLAEDGDLEEILPLTPLIASYNVRSPVFAILPAGFLDQLADAHRREFSSEHATYLVAENENKIIGFSMIHHSGNHPLWPNPTAEFAVNAVAEEHRRNGVGLALALGAINWAFDAGHQHISADWRTGNIPAQRAWTKAGFNLTGWRMARVIEKPSEKLPE